MNINNKMMQYRIPVEVKISDAEFMDEMEKRVLEYTWEEAKPLVESKLKVFTVEFKYQGVPISAYVPRDLFIQIWYLM